MRIQGNDIPLARTLLVGLNKYNSALLVKGKARRKPHKFFNEVVDDIITHRGEQDKAGILLFQTISKLIRPTGFKTMCHGIIFL